MKEEYRNSLAEFRSIDKKIDQLKAMEKERARLEDLYKYQVNEIVGARLKMGEDEELLQQSNIPSNAEEIIEALNNTYFSLIGEDGVAIGLLSKYKGLKLR